MKTKHLQLMFYTALLLTGAFLFVLPAVFAQDATPDAPPAATQEADTGGVDEGPGDGDVLGDETVPQPSGIGDTIAWALGFVALWQAAGVALAVAIEKSVKPVLYAFVAQFTDSVPVRNTALIVTVFVGAFYMVFSGNVNLFADAPFSALRTAPQWFLLALNSVFAAAGAFLGHEVWEIIQTYLRKAKAVADIVSAPKAPAASS